MKLTRQQRINNTGSTMVNTLREMATEYRKLLTDGIDVPAGAKGAEGYPELKASGDEIRAALGENAKEVETVLSFILDGKSNKITKGQRR